MQASGRCGKEKDRTPFEYPASPRMKSAKTDEHGLPEFRGQSHCIKPREYSGLRKTARLGFTFFRERHPYRHGLETRDYGACLSMHRKKKTAVHIIAYGNGAIMSRNK